MRRIAVFWGIMMIWAIPVQAQSVRPENPLSRDIQVYQYAVDPATGAAQARAQWPWLDFSRYYDLLMQLPAVAFVPDGVARQMPTDPAPILVEEKAADGRVLRQILVRNNTVQVTAVTYVTKDFSDVDNIYALLRAETTRRANAGQSASTGGFFDLKSNINGANFTWGIQNQQDSDALWAMLQNMPPISDYDKTKTPNYFNSISAIHITINNPKKGQPNRIDLDNLQARFTYIEPMTQTYYDRIGFKKFTLGQQELAKFYKDRQIKPPPKTY